MTAKFWSTLEQLIANSQIVIDRPKGQPHPRYAELIYPFDYGYLEGTTAGDGAGIDIWLGSNAGKTLTGILCTLDTIKRDAEIKLLVNCTTEDVEKILRFQNQMTSHLYIAKDG